jgi:Tfp pilus assembly protein PilP
MIMTTRITRVMWLVAAVAVASPAHAQRTPQQLVAGAMDSGQATKGAQPPKGAAPAPAPAPGTPGQAAPPAKKVDLPSPPPNFEYAPQGRRDPFLSLVDRGEDKKSNSDTNPSAVRADGVPGMMTAELVVRGIMQTRGSWVAMVSGANKKVYTVRAGDKLADGVIRSINASSVVILQEVNDPLSLDKQREVRKLLRGGEEVK